MAHSLAVGQYYRAVIQHQPVHGYAIQGAFDVENGSYNKTGKDVAKLYNSKCFQVNRRYVKDIMIM